MTRRATLPDLLHAAPTCGDRHLLERYLAHGEQAAFAALLHRHGPMVLGLCRRLLRDEHLAEDVFQATFLVLARKAHAIRKRDSVASWLHGVVARLARQARLSEAAFTARQPRGARRETVPTDPTWDELLRLLHEELAGLPDRFRAPLLLCYLEGQTQDEAATQLGLSLRTLRRRLEAGRDLLRERLTKRGATLGAGLFAAALAPSAGAAVVSESLRQGVFAALEADASGGTLPASVAVLANGGSAMFTVSKLLVVLTTALLAVTVTATALHPRPEPTHAADTPAPVEPIDHPTPSPLPKGAVARLGTMAFRHGRVVWNSTLTFTPDGKHLVSAGGGWINRWDVATGEAVVALGDGWRGRLAGVDVVTADGRVGRIAHGWNRVKEYDLETGKERRAYKIEFPPKTASSHGLPRQMSPDGKFHVELSDHAGMTIWDSTGAFLHHLKPIRGSFTAVAFSADGKWILVGDSFHDFHFYDLKTGLLDRTFGDARQDYCVSRMALSADGRWLATASVQKGSNPPINPHDLCVRSWDLKRGRVAHTLEFPEDGGVESLLFTPDNQTLIAGCRGWGKGQRAAVRTWDVTTGKVGRAWADDPNVGLFVAVRPDGKMLATMTEQGVIRLWDRASGKEIRPTKASSCGLDAVCFTNDGKKILTAGSDLSLREWEAGSGKLLRVTTTGAKGFMPMFSSRGSFLQTATWRDDNLMAYRILDPASGKLLHEGIGTCPVISPDEKRLAFQDKDHRIQILDLATRKVLRTLTPPAEGSLFGSTHPVPRGFSADGQRLILQAEKLSVWDLRTGKQLTAVSLKEHAVLVKPKDTRHSWERLERVAVSPDGQTIAIGVLKDGPVENGVSDWFGKLFVFATSGKLLHQIDLGNEAPERLAFSPDGTRMAVAGDWKVQVWDVKTGKVLQDFEGHRGRINAVAFSPDGTRLATASDDSTVLIWDVSRR